MILAGAQLDRCADRRCDSDWVADQRDHSHARFLKVMDDRLLVQGSPPRRELDTARDHGHHILAEALLGIDTQGPIFVQSLEADEGAHTLSLRTAALEFDEDALSWGAYALGLVQWWARQRYCARCGAATALLAAGFEARCHECQAVFYPRVDPAVIMRVEHGDRILLARQAHWQARRHSVLAGFVEPGESLEDAVAREVMEETGLTVDQVSYRRSQPWPFPHSLMVAYACRAGSTRLTLSEELEEAAWYDVESLAQAMASGKLSLPAQVSVSRWLIDEWAAARGARTADWETDST